MFGFRNTFESEAIPGGLPKHQNNPQKHGLGLYTEQLSGTSFTRSPRSHNLFMWMYRLLPSVAHGNKESKFESIDNTLPCALDAKTLEIDPNVGRWNPVSSTMRDDVDFLDGLRLFGQAGCPIVGEGLSIYWVDCQKSMENRSMSFCDGDILFVPQSGEFVFQTELGEISVKPKEICSIPRGIKFTVRLVSSSQEAATHCGYLAEVYNEAGFKLPELGLIGANGLANPLHFEHPSAKFNRDEDNVQWKHVNKVGGSWFQRDTLCSPFDVVAWRGNMVPFKYDLNRFNTMGTVSFDHPDPSIFTVLTVPTSTPGLAAMDFVLFPPRWLVATNTFRPPYFHRNCMTEFMGLICGEYDGKIGKSGFVPGGASLHSRMQPHGPNAAAFELGVKAKLNPVFMDKGMAFMFETPYLLKLSEFARTGQHRQLDYESTSWTEFKRAKL